MNKNSINSLININSYKEAEKISKDWKESGKTQREFCKSRNILYGSFMCWRSKVKERTPGETGNSAFKEVKIIDSKPIVTSAREHNISINLPNDIIIKIPLNFREETLDNLFRVIKGIIYA